MKKEITAQKIADFLNKELFGEDIKIHNAVSIKEFQNNSCSFSINEPEDEITSKRGLILIKNDLTLKGNHQSSYIRCENPRLEFARVLNEYFNNVKHQNLRSSSFISKTAKIKESVKIGAHCFIGDSVEIGKNTIINHNVTIESNTIIGDNCYFKSGTVIGEDGFGFEIDENRKPVRVPHIGKVVIGNNVEIGANNTVVRATLGETKVSNYTKTDDHVHIAHNCNIGERTLITACAEISGSVTMGSDCWIGPNSSLMNNIVLGDYIMIGLGTVVTKGFGNFSLLAGSPAKRIGWVSRAREKLILPASGEGEAICNKTGIRYVLTKKGLEEKV